jgi:hypothetical protein
MKIVLYSTDCPKCKVLEKKLNAQGMEYSVNKSIKDMRALKILEAPMLCVDGDMMDFMAALNWLKTKD